MLLGVAGAAAVFAAALLMPRAAVLTPEEAPVLGAYYASPLESVETHVLSRGETLSGVLAQAQITGAEFADLLLALRGHLNPRGLSPGAEITVRRWMRDGAMRSVDLRVNADTTLRLHREPYGWASEVVLTPVAVDTVWVSGRIEAGRSLYTALMHDDALDLPQSERVQLVDDLSRIYAYKLDFSREIQPGDVYRLVYEREARPDGTTRRRRILAAELENQGRSYPAVHFVDSRGNGEYYDLNGRALRFGFRRSPLDYVRITSSFSWRRYHPVLGVYRAHLGMDYGAPTGTPVRATADGTVAFAGRDGGYGNLIRIRHFGGYETRYAHLSRFATGIRPGRAVKQEQVIGYVGATGLATGPHLHYELRKDGRPVNPREVRSAPAPELPAAERPVYELLVGYRMALLDQGTRPGPRLAAGSGDGAGAIGAAGGM